MRRLMLGASLVIALAIGGCGGGDRGRTSGGGDAESAITHMAEQWAKAYATQDPAYCAYEPDRSQKLCRNYLAGGEPTIYQTGYLNAKVAKIDLTSQNMGVVTLSNGCKVEVADEGGGDWRVTNSGGSLARGCEQGVGR